MPSDTAHTDLAAQTCVIVLTLNAQRYMPGLLDAIARLRHAPARVLFVDSSSDDATVALATAAGHSAHVIRRAEFGHGRTRNQAAALCTDCRFMVFLTQDACPQGEDWLSCLLEPFSDQRVALVYGRQLPRPEADGPERYARLFNYPDRSDRSDVGDLVRRGIKAVFCSNSFSAYRTEAFHAVGGFPERLPLGEDMAVALRLLQKGHARVYQPRACAVHSHAYSVVEELRRYFDIGTLMSMDAELRRVRLAASGEGLRFLRGELASAWNPRRPQSAIRVILRAGAKYVGFSLGQRYELLPLAWRRRLSMHSFFWSQ
jgi:rhamnosyltransferase